MPTEGGTAELIQGLAVPDAKISADVGHSNLSLSPDGKWLTKIETSTDVNTRKATPAITLIDVTTRSTAPKYFIPRPDIGDFIAATPDGKAVVYNINENGIGNTWMQPLDGSPGHRLTNFASDRSAAFSFSPDGKSLAVTRIQEGGDVFLLRDASPASQ